MKRLRLTDLPDHRDGHFLKGIIPGEYLSHGGLTFKKGGQRTHDGNCDCSACDGKGHHIHANDREVFIILQGKAKMEIDGEFHNMTTGDIIICDPGEDHHLISDKDDPCVNIWIHAADARSAQQT